MLIKYARPARSSGRRSSARPLRSRLRFPSSTRRATRPRRLHEGQSRRRARRQHAATTSSSRRPPRAGAVEWMTQVGSPSAAADRGYGIAVGATARSTSPATRMASSPAGRTSATRRLPRAVRCRGAARRRGSSSSARRARTRAWRSRPEAARSTSAAWSPARSLRRSGHDARGLDGFLAKFSTAGAPSWTKQIGTAGDEQIWGVAADAAGDATVAGYTSGDLFASQQGDKDIVVATFDSIGAVTANDQLGTIGNDKGASVALDGAGNTYVSGFSDGNLETNIGDFDAVLIKYGPGLARIWARQFGTTESDGADPFAEGNVFLCHEGQPDLGVRLHARQHAHADAGGERRRVPHLVRRHRARTWADGRGREGGSGRPPSLVCSGLTSNQGEHMTRTLLAATSGIAAFALTAGSAFGVLPKKSGVYVGDIQSSPVPHARLPGCRLEREDRPVHVPVRHPRPTADDDQRTRDRRQGLLQVRREPHDRARLEAGGALRHTDDCPDLAELDRLRRLEGLGDREAEVKRPPAEHPAGGRRVDDPRPKVLPAPESPAADRPRPRAMRSRPAITSPHRRRRACSTAAAMPSMRALPAGSCSTSCSPTCATSVASRRSSCARPAVNPAPGDPAAHRVERRRSRDVGMRGDARGGAGALRRPASARPGEHGRAGGAGQPGWRRSSGGAHGRSRSQHRRSSSPRTASRSTGARRIRSPLHARRLGHDARGLPARWQGRCRRATCSASPSSRRCCNGSLLRGTATIVAERSTPRGREFYEGETARTLSSISTARAAAGSPRRGSGRVRGGRRAGDRAALRRLGRHTFPTRGARGRRCCRRS